VNTMYISEQFMFCLAWFISTCSAQCRVPTSPPERRAVSSSIVVKALLSSVSSEGGKKDLAEIWIQEVYKGSEKLAAIIGVFGGHSGSSRIYDRRVNVSNWNSTCVELSKDQSQILLLVPHKHQLSLSKRPGSIIQHSEMIEQKMYKLMGWQDWSSWDSCSTSCNGGIQERSRRCSSGRDCEGRGREGRVCNTFSCQGSINALTVENPRYFKPYKRSMHKLTERLFGWSMKSGSYFLIPYKEAFGLPFPSQFTILISFKPDKESEGVIFSLTDPESKQDNLSLNIGKEPSGKLNLKLVHSSSNGTRTVPVPVTLAGDIWTQLAISIQQSTSIKTYVDCAWVTTQIIDGHSFNVPTNPDLVIGYLVQASIDQFTVTNDPSDVSEQCSVTKTSLDNKQISNQERTTMPTTKAKAVEKPELIEGSVDIQEGSGDLLFENDVEKDDEIDSGSGSFDLEWSEWSPCGASCRSSTQSRWSRCADSGAMMECIQAGGEKKVTRTCNIVPCNQLEVVKDELQYNSQITAEDISRVRKHKKLDSRLIRTSKNTSFDNASKREHYHTIKDEVYPMDKLDLAQLPNPCKCHISGHCNPETLICTCSSGWTGRDCGQPECRPECSNGGVCVRPDVCACKPGFTGARCQQAFCHPECQNGGVCVSPFKCQCPQGTSGKHCQKLTTCSPPCANGGVCNPMKKCSCLSGFSGNDCKQTTCKMKCRNGGLCSQNQTCICKQGFYGDTCQKSSCLSYVRVKEPHLSGYRRILSLSKPKGDIPARPQYKIFYRTVYRNVTKCKEDLRL